MHSVCLERALRGLGYGGSLLAQLQGAYGIGKCLLHRGLGRYLRLILLRLGQVRDAGNDGVVNSGG